MFEHLPKQRGPKVTSLIWETILTAAMNELITIISLWLKKRWSLIYKYRIAFPSSKNLFSQVWLKLAQPRYLTVLLISPLGKHLNKLNPLFTLGCLIWSKFDWNWHSGSGEGFWIPYYSLLLLFHYIANISPWKKSVTLHLNKVIYSRMLNFDEVCFILAQWLRGRRPVADPGISKRGGAVLAR